jgi:hypothetical protein
MSTTNSIISFFCCNCCLGANSQPNPRNQQPAPDPMHELFTRGPAAYNAAMDELEYREEMARYARMHQANARAAQSRGENEQKMPPAIRAPIVIQAPAVISANDGASPSATDSMEDFRPSSLEERSLSIGEFEAREGLQEETEIAFMYIADQMDRRARRELRLQKAENMAEIHAYNDREAQSIPALDDGVLDGGEPSQEEGVSRSSTPMHLMRGRSASALLPQPSAVSPSSIGSAAGSPPLTLLALLRERTPSPGVDARSLFDV